MSGGKSEFRCNFDSRHMYYLKTKIDPKEAQNATIHICCTVSERWGGGAGGGKHTSSNNFLKWLSSSFDPKVIMQSQKPVVSS